MTKNYQVALEAVKKLTKKELTALGEHMNDIVKMIYENEGATIKAQLRVGETVFVKIKGTIEEGSVLKKNPKKAKVMIADLVYNVPYSMISKERQE